jgi:RND family efflux transporter MFP subunit
MESSNTPPEFSGKPKRSSIGSILLRWLIVLVVVALLGSLLYSGFRSRQKNEEELAVGVRENARLPVSVGHPVQSAAAVTGTYPANIRAYVETPIYARTNGYLKRWLVDIGAKVQPGQLLAEIDTPEVDQQLKQSEATLNAAQSTVDLDRTTATRYQDLIKSDGVSQQEVDMANGALKTDQGKLRAAQADVDRWKFLQSFKQVTAPFAGTITARLVDPGALIANGNSTILFRLADTATLRVYTDVPEDFSHHIAVGMPGTLEVPSNPGKKFTGTVVRTSGAIDPANRTLLTEVQVLNPKGELLPGEYGQVTFNLKPAGSSVIVQASAVLFRPDGPQVAVVDDSGKVHMQPIKLGRDSGRTLEVIEGLKGEETIILNPSDSITEGTLVKPVPVQEK